MAAHCDHSHSHGHGAIRKYSNVLLLATVMNLVYVVVEVFFGVTQQSLALLSDAGHNLSDVFTLVISLLAFYLASKSPTEKYTYGYKKLTILVALANAILLVFAVAVIWYEAILRLYHPDAVNGHYITVVAAIGFLINGASALLFMKHKDSELNMKGAYLHLLADALVSLAVVASGIVISYTNWFWLDTAASFLIGAVILSGTWGLLRDTLKLSMDGVPAHIDMAKIKDAIRNTDSVIMIEALHVSAISTTETILTAKITLSAGLSFNDVKNIRDQIQHKLSHLGIAESTIECTGQ